MKIILKKDVHGLGYKDEVLTVKDGYGRNYLLPQGLAVLATEKAIKQLNEELKQRAHKIAKIKADAEAAAKKFEGVSLTIKAKVSEGKNIYGSVGSKEIAAALAEKGLELDSKFITIKGVKALGSYEARGFRCHPIRGSERGRRAGFCQERRGSKGSSCRGGISSRGSSCNRRDSC